MEVGGDDGRCWRFSFRSPTASSFHLEDAATGILTTVDGWKLRAKMYKLKTADGGERVVKKFVKLDDDQLRRLQCQASQPQTPNTLTQSDDLLARKVSAMMLKPIEVYAKSLFERPDERDDILR